MKILICGSRDWTNRDMIRAYVEHQKEIFADDLVIIDGGAEGADIMASAICTELDIPFREYPITPMHRRFFKNSAGRVRNEEMYRRERPHRIVAFKHRDSPGTEHMISVGKEHDVEVEVYYDEEEEE